MTRDEFRKIAYELHCLLSGVQRTAKMISELETAYEGCTRWNEKLRAELEGARQEAEQMREEKWSWESLEGPPDREADSFSWEEE